MDMFLSFSLVTDELHLNKTLIHTAIEIKFLVKISQESHVLSIRKIIVLMQWNLCFQILFGYNIFYEHQ